MLSADTKCPRLAVQANEARLYIIKHIRLDKDGQFAIPLVAIGLVSLILMRRVKRGVT